MRLSVLAFSRIAMETLRKWFPLRLTLHPLVCMTTSATVAMLAEAGTAISGLFFLVMSITQTTVIVAARVIQFQPMPRRRRGSPYAGHIVVCFLNILRALLTEYKSVMVRAAPWIDYTAGESKTVL